MAELITNGTFTTSTTGWGVLNAATIVATGGRLRVTNSEAGVGSATTELAQVISVTSGATYHLTVDAFAGTSGGWRVRAGAGAFTIDVSMSVDGSVDDTFVATANLAAVQLDTGSANNLENSEFDNVSLMEMAPEEAQAMATTLIQNGDALKYTTTGAVTKGDVKIVGSTMVGVALDTATTGETIPLATRGVWQVTRTAAATLTAQGANVYFTSAGAAVATTTANVFGGKLWEAVATSSTTCHVNINFGSESV